MELTLEVRLQEQMVVLAVVELDQQQELQEHQDKVMMAELVKLAHLEAVVELEL